MVDRTRRGRRKISLNCTGVRVCRLVREERSETERSIAERIPHCVDRIFVHDDKGIGGPGGRHQLFDSVRETYRSFVAAFSIVDYKCPMYAGLYKTLTVKFIF